MSEKQIPMRDHAAERMRDDARKKLAQQIGALKEEAAILLMDWTQDVALGRKKFDDHEAVFIDLARIGNKLRIYHAEMDS